MERREFLRGMAVLAATRKWLLAQQNSDAVPAIPAPVPWTLGAESADAAAAYHGRRRSG